MTSTADGSRVSQAAGVTVVVMYLVGGVSGLALEHRLELNPVDLPSLGMLTGFTWFAALGGLIVAAAAVWLRPAAETR